MSDFTLQINLSAGDSAYAALTVPRLLAAHPEVTERLLVVDLCKPQKTKIVDPELRFPEPGYSRRRDTIVHLTEGWLASGAVDRVVYLRPGDPLLTVLSRTYLRSWVRETHDYGGCALMAYLAAFEMCRTRWLIHYDADMLLYQDPGFDWALQAREVMKADRAVVAAIPRPSPPPLDGPDAPSENERLAMHEQPDGWLSGWFSTRCFLFDLASLRPCLPLLQGRLLWETIAVRLLRRGYPRSPEILLFRRMAAAGLSRLTLNDRRAWLLHPVNKGAAFVGALPRLQAAIANGECPAAQRGQQDLLLDAWSI